MSYLSTVIKKARYLIDRDTDRVLVLEKNNGTFVDVVLDTPEGRNAAIAEAVGNLLAGSPVALNTLNELANALGDDANFASTVALALSNRLQVSQNLADVASASAARMNLGLGSAALHPDTDFDTPSNRDTAIATALTNLLNGAPGTLDTLNELAMALGDDPNFSATMATALANRLQVSLNLSDVPNPATARTNLGLGTAATHPATDFDTPSGRDTAIATAISNLLNGAPGALDTLNELATALGDDPSFATTITTALSNRLVWRGAWSAGTVYVRNDFVLFNGGLYVAPTNFTSGASFVKTNWTELAPQFGTYAAVGSVASVVDITAPAYGATTASSNASAAVQAAITAAGVNGSIYIPAGTFKAHGLSMLSGQRMWGPGTLQRPAGSTSDLITCRAVSDVVLDVKLDGGYGSTLTWADRGTQTGHLVLIDGGSSNVRVRGTFKNNQGNGVRIADCNRCGVDWGRFYNLVYGVTIGLAGDANAHGLTCNYCWINDVTIDTVAANGIYICGNTAGNSLTPIQIYGHRINQAFISNFGDTALELGYGSNDCIVTNLHIDGNNAGLNGILIRDCTGHSITGFTIKNIPMFANGSATYLTQGNGIMTLPFGTGVMSDITISNGIIKNCSRGVYLQGQNNGGNAITYPGGGAATPTFTDGVATNGSTTFTSASATFLSSDVGKTIAASGTIPGGTTIASVTNSTTVVLSAAATASATGLSFTITGKYVYNGITISNVQVDGSNLGTVTGADATALNLHGFYVQSMSGVNLVNCVARNCLNDGFRIGDVNYFSSFVRHVHLVNCIAVDNGGQAVGGQTYNGFYINGTSSQSDVSLNGCQASCTTVGTSRTQNYGFNWNGTGTQSDVAKLVDCTATNHPTANFNTVSSTTASDTSMVKIAETTLSGNAAQLDFQSIPSTYKHLVIELYGRSDAAASNNDGVSIALNNDTNDASYDRESLHASGTTASAAEARAGSGSRQCGVVAGALSPSNHFSHTRILIPNYAGSGFKVLTATVSSPGARTTGSILSRQYTLLWASTSAVNRITLVAGGNFVAGTVASVYALRSAA